MAMLNSSPWIDHASLSAWVSRGLFGEHGGRALQLHQEGFCTFHPSASAWRSLVARAGQESLTNFDSPGLRQLAIHSELVDFLSLLYGRRAYPTVLPDLKPTTSGPLILANQYQSQPLGFHCGAFIALEDINVGDNVLCLYQGSHLHSSSCLGGSFDFQKYLQLNGSTPRLIKANFGDVVIIHSHLIHFFPAMETSRGCSWAPVLNFFFEGCRIIDTSRSLVSKKNHYVKCIDLATSGLRPNWRDQYLRLRNPGAQLEVPESPLSAHLTEQPLIDCDHFEHLLSEGHFGSCSKLAKQLNAQGFGLLTIQDPNWLKLLDEVRHCLEPHVDLQSLSRGTLKPKRFQDAWLHQDISAVSKVACHPEILASLQVLYGRIPFPFQTLNFPNGTAQHFHSDAVHFHSLPHGFMCGVWVALEDISVKSGPLVYYPGSHRLPYLTARDLGLTEAEILGVSNPQKFFEPHWRDCVATNAYPRCLFEARKGDVLVWHANLLHGGSPVRNKTLSRWSQVTHYFFEGCDYTTPLFQTIDASDKGLQWRSPIPIRAAD